MTTRHTLVCLPPLDDPREWSEAIDEAIEQSRKALKADPANLYLNNHFAASRNRKLALLRRATALALGDSGFGG